MEYRIVLLPLLLVILFFLYYTNFKSNMIVILSLVIILVIYDLLNNSEYFEADKAIDSKLFDFESNPEIRNILIIQAQKINNLENLIRIISKYKSKDKQKRASLRYPNIPLYNSCIMLDSDGNLGDPIPDIPDSSSIYSVNNPHHHIHGKHHSIYNNILNQLKQ